MLSLALFGVLSSSSEELRDLGVNLRQLLEKMTEDIWDVFLSLAEK